MTACDRILYLHLQITCRLCIILHGLSLVTRSHRAGGTQMPPGCLHGRSLYFSLELSHWFPHAELFIFPLSYHNALHTLEVYTALKNTNLPLACVLNNHELFGVNLKSANSFKSSLIMECFRF